MIRVLAGNVVLSGRLSCGKVVLDPEVLLDLAFEHGFGRFDTVPAEVFAFGNNTYANHIVMLWDVPEPAFVRDVRNSGCTLIDARIPFCSLVIGPDGDLVQVRIADPPIVSRYGERLFTRAVQGDGRAKFPCLSVLLRAHADYPAVLM